MKQVEMRLAFEWTCERCGRDNFEHAQVCGEERFTEDELRELRDVQGIQPWETGHWLAKPAYVNCECGAVFKTDDFDG